MAAAAHTRRNTLQEASPAANSCQRMDNHKRDNLHEHQVHHDGQVQDPLLSGPAEGNGCAQTRQQRLRLPDTDPNVGLDPTSVSALRLLHGRNLPPPARSRPLWSIVLSEVKEPMNLMLLAVAPAYFAIGEHADAIAVTLAVLLMVALEVASDVRAKRAVQRLTVPPPTMVSVRREGQVQVISTADLVPGDVVVLETGQAAPADLIVVEASLDLTVQQAMYTGESEPVSKRSLAALDHPRESDEEEEVVLENVILSTSVLTGGRGMCDNGTFIVTATGSRTRLAAMGGFPPLKQPSTVLAQFMKRLATTASIMAITVTILVTLFGTFVLHRHWQEMILFGLTLAFVTLPEELPLMVKLVLASTAADLARNHNVLVRRLRSLEQLADIKAVVTDKTGTLTQGVMTLAGVWYPMSNAMSQPPSYPPLEPTTTAPANHEDASANYAPLMDLPTVWSLSAIHPADPYDAAVRSVWCLTAPRIHRSPALVHASPSDPIYLPIHAHSHMVLASRVDPTTMIRETVRDWAPLGTLTIMRGAPEAILARATHIASDNGQHAVPLGKTLRAAVHARWASAAGRGYRMIGVAVSISPGGTRPWSSSTSSSLSSSNARAQSPSSSTADIICLGCLAFSDPLRPGAHAFLTTARSNGTHLVLATGDHPGTAHAIDRALGSVFSEVHSRCTPEHKRRLVEHLMHTYSGSGRAGAGVLAVGDGGNDAPAMRAASVAAVMANSPGRADAALDSADLILLGDQGLQGLAHALRVAPWARSKVRQAVAFYLGCKVALVTLTCVALGVMGELPLTPPMLLVQEISMDLGATLVFASEAFPEHIDGVGRMVGGGSVEDEDGQGKGWARGLIRWTAACGAVLGLPTVLAYVLGLTCVLGAGPAMARTMAFATYVPAQVVVAYAMRSPVAPIRVHGFWAPVCLMWAVINVTLTIVLVGTGTMGLVPLQREAVVVCCVAALLPLVLDVVKEVQWSAREREEGQSPGRGRHQQQVPLVNDETAALLMGVEAGVTRYGV